jgi:hypothetical protein
MGIEISSLNEKQRALIDPADRRLLKIFTSKERIAKAERGMERKEHEIVLAWCYRHEIKYIHAACHRRVRDLEPGFPDFLFYRAGRYLLVEIKVTGGQLSDDQRKFHLALTRQGDEVRVTHSGEETIRLVKAWLSSGFQLDS